MHVLICDDEEDIRLLYRGHFEANGATVSEARDGDEAIVAAGAEHPDLIILDLFMPVRDGLSALPELRRRCPGIPILVVSAHAAVEVFSESRSRGATACFDKLGFHSRIPHVLERYRAAAV